MSPLRLLETGLPPQLLASVRQTLQNAELDASVSSFSAGNADDLTRVAGSAALLIADELADDLLKRARGHGWPIPVIVIAPQFDEARIVALVKAGAADVVSAARLDALPDLLRQVRPSGDAERDLIHLLTSTAPISLFHVDAAARFTLYAGTHRVADRNLSAQFYGRTVFDLFPDHVVAHNIRRALAGETFSSIVEWEEAIWQVSYLPMQDAGKVTGVFGIGIDITEQMRVVSELRKSDERFMSLFDTMPVGMAILNEQGQVLELNDQAAALMGCRRGEMRGQRLVPRLFPPESPDHEVMQDALRHRRSLRNIESHLRSGSGHDRHALIALEPIDLGSEHGTLVIALDITERKQAEQAILEAERARLEVEQERQIVHLRESYISMVSHEFRNPLAAIVSSSQILSVYHDRMDNDRRLHHLSQITAQALYLTDLLEDLTAISMMRSGRLTFQPRTLDLVALCQQVIDALNMGREGHEFSFRADGPIQINADPRLVRYILNNLLSNAHKYTPSGGHIRLALERTADEVQIRVSDSGIGIPAEDLPTIFEPFHRARNTGQVTGTGLGLALVKHSVDIHGGDIHVESHVDQGTTITVHLPLSPRSP